MSDESYIDLGQDRSLWWNRRILRRSSCSRCEFRRMAQMRQPDRRLCKGAALLKPKTGAARPIIVTHTLCRSRLHGGLRLYRLASPP